MAETRENHAEDASVLDPAKLLRIAAMTKSLLVDIRMAPPDESGKKLVSKIYDRSLDELRDVFGEELLSEFNRMFEPLLDEDGATHSEVRVAQAQLIGWLEGLLQGIQASVNIRRMMAQSQAEQRAPSLIKVPDTHSRRGGMYL